MARLPDFQLETYFSRWEFNTKYNMCASDVESVSLRELLLLSSKEDIELWNSLGLGYTETFGSLKIREAIANTYDNISASDIITFAGAEEGIYVTMNCILNKNDHAIVITPNYQSSETLPRSICEVTGIGLDPNNNWNLDIQKIIDELKIVRNSELLKNSERKLGIKLENVKIGIKANKKTYIYLMMRYID